MQTRTRQHWMAAVLAAWLLLLPAAALADKPAPPPHGQPPAENELANRARVSREEAIAAARTGLAIPAEWPEPEVHIWQNGPAADNLIWTVRWTSGETPAVVTHVGVDAMTGRVVNLSVEDPRLWGMAPVKLTVDREQARPAAEALVKRLAPAELAQAELQPAPTGPLGPDQRLHSFVWVRMANGIPFPQNNIWVSVSAIDGRVIHYGHTWTEQAAFVPADQLVEQEAALAVARKLARAQLIYHRTGDGPHAAYRLFYRFNGMVRIDARTGQTYTGPDAQRYDGETVAPDAQTPPLPRGPVATAEAAAVLARQALGLDPGLEPQAVHQWPADPYHPEGAWNVEFAIPGVVSGQSAHGAVLINAGTGRINNMWMSLPYQELAAASPALNEAQARALALAHVRTFYGPELPELRMAVTPVRAPAEPGQPESDRMAGYQFQFTRVVNGVPVEGEGIHLMVNAAAGRIENAGINWGHAALPELAGLLSEDTASRIWWDRHQLRLIYSTHPGFGWLDGPGSLAGPLEAVPVWEVQMNPERPAPSPYLDAGTGRFVDWQGTEVVDPAHPLTDLAGHPQREALEYLLNRQALRPRQGQIIPDAPLTRLEALVLLVRLFPHPKDSGMWKEPAGRYYTDLGPGHPNHWEVQQALAWGLIPPPEPNQALGADQPATRAEFALMLGRALGLARVEQARRPLSLGYADADQMPLATRNMVAMLAALGVLLDEEESEFQPDLPITRADAAALAYAAVQLDQSE